MEVARQQAVAWPSHLVDLGTFCRGNKIIWRDLQFDLSVSGWTGFLGKSGIGKTTLLRCLAGIEACQPASFKSHKVALLAQSDNLLPWATVLQNVVIGSTLRGGEVDKVHALDLLQQVGLENYAAYYPMQLSVGMRQRVALARTLYEKADLILLDEPFTALDTKMKHELYQLTQALLADKTVIIVTHDPLEALALCQRIYLFKGKPPTLVPFPLSTPAAQQSFTFPMGSSPDLHRLMEEILCDSV